MTKKQVMVVGGGAAGFFAAINLARLSSNVKVTILEKTQKVLSKVKVSGGGRCNVTHACFNPRELSTNYPRGEKELIGPFHRFAAGDTISWFSERNVEIKVEDDGRMFPVTDSSQTIIDCFIEEAKNHHVTIRKGEELVELSQSKNFDLKLKSGERIVADFVIVACGGNAKAKHYDFLAKLGHQIQKPIPSLFTFNLPKHPSNELMGLSYPGTVKIDQTNFEEYGPVLFTHWGMSGPVILKLSAKAAAYLHKKNYQFSYTVNWLNNAHQWIKDNRQKRASSVVEKTIPEDMPKRMWGYLLKRSGVDKGKNWADLKKDQMEKLQQALEADRYQANGKTTFKEEFVTCGGVELSEIEMKSMQSKLVPNLYFCGEVMNVDALTGGFNFQAAWTSAMLVAQNIAERVNSDG